MDRAELIKRLEGVSDGLARLGRNANEMYALTQTLDTQKRELEKDNARLREALEPFAKIPLRGKHGGPLVIGRADYEDMCEGDSAPRAAYFHRQDVERARIALNTDKSEAS